MPRNMLTPSLTNPRTGPSAVRTIGPSSSFAFWLIADVESTPAARSAPSASARARTLRGERSTATWFSYDFIVSLPKLLSSEPASQQRDTTLRDARVPCGRVFEVDPAASRKILRNLLNASELTAAGTEFRRDASTTSAQ